MELLYERLCPSCGGWGEASFIAKFGVCRRCAIQNNKWGLNALSFIKEIESSIKDFTNFFERITGGYKLWGSQKAWIKRLLKKENTSIIAPTGIGKTTLLIAYALYNAAMYKEKVLILTPTASLAKQTYNKIIEMNKRINNKCKILFYDSRLSKKRRDEIISSIKNGEYDILLVTNSFLARNSHLFKEKYFDVIIADDVDAILNRSRNIILILNMLGYPNEAIELTKKIINLKSRLIIAKINSQEEIYQKLLKEYLELESKLYKVLKNKKKGQLVIASATGRARGVFVSIMRELLSLDVTGITLYARNVTDVFKLINSSNEIANIIMEIVTKLGSGGIILLSPYNPLRSKVDINEIINHITKKGIRVSKATPSSIQRLIKGELDLVIGSSSYYGVSVRGIDSPEKIRYVVFIGTPVFVTELESILCSPRTLYRLLIHLKELGFNVSKHLIELSKILRYTSPNELRLIRDLLRNKIDLDSINNDKIKEKYSILKSIIEDIIDKYKEILDGKKVVRIGTIILYKTNERYLALIPDVMTYIQASGRTSRLYKGKMTYGLSIIIEDINLIELIEALEARLRYYNNNSKFVNYEDIDLSNELMKIKASRLSDNDNRIDSSTLRYKSVLIVVESPTKAKTIARFYGKPSKRRIGTVTVYEVPVVKNNNIVYLSVVATRGHIYDLSTDLGNSYGIDLINAKTNIDIKMFYRTIKRCRVCGHQFTDGDFCPRCGSRYYIDSIEVVNVLRKLSSEVDEVVIATDPDMEGEKIAYDVFLIVKPINNNVYRIELHEITPRELEKALSNKRTIDLDLVNAQVFRRSLDRLIGFSLSQQLWSTFNKNWLGAGRVQTPVLGWIINNYIDYLKNRCYGIKLIVGKTKPYLKISICIDNKDRAKDIATILNKKGVVKAIITNRIIDEVKPKPPYTTDELLFDASKIGVPATLTMKIAQELFESGLITYHRTDSTYVSTQGIELAKHYLVSKHLQELFTGRHWGTQGTHEAIRPTNPWDPQDIEKLYGEGVLQIPIYLTPIHLKIYDLIFRRFIASQMKPYRRLLVGMSIEITNDIIIDLSIPVKIIDQGFNTIMKPEVYEWINDDMSQEIHLPIQSIKLFRTSKTRLFTQGQVIKMMKERGIGRPSTYTTTLNTLRRHGYVIFSKKRSYVIPTKIGISIYEFLNQNYNELVSEETTRWMEIMIDKIKLRKIPTENAIREVVSLLTRYSLPITAGEKEAREIMI